jgi:hypothetical protein
MISANIWLAAGLLVLQTTRVILIVNLHFLSHPPQALLTTSKGESPSAHNSRPTGSVYLLSFFEGNSDSRRVLRPRGNILGTHDQASIEANLRHEQLS